MIAAIERSQRVVWGIGNTTAEAMQDAGKVIASKPHFKVSELELAELAPEADLGADGPTLWQWVQLPEATPVQETLF